jgi:hypothetical protein
VRADPRLIRSATTRGDCSRATAIRDLDCDREILDSIS